jgi:hypothetical protein
LRPCVERVQHRAFGERLNNSGSSRAEEEKRKNLVQAQTVMNRIIKRFNAERLHSVLGDLRPADDYQGDPQAKKEARRLKLAQVRQRRRERNLKRKIFIGGARHVFQTMRQFEYINLHGSLSYHVAASHSSNFW